MFNISHRANAAIVATVPLTAADSTLLIETLA